ncbi:Pyruvate/Phosphoenolpyruvate kinase-like domain-containing protein [Xylariales sp. PMI_506]|nr:Pyruvate/Phosphoenolpyruvate kinase-like domain-containing protein [Xylariales sp. PMI_506]
MGSTTNGSAPQGMQAYAAPSLFQPHNARQAIRDAHEGRIAPLLCVYYGLSSVPLARFLAPFGFDAVWIDWEHTSCGVETMTTIVHETMFMSGGRTIPFVRVPGHDHAAIGYALDCGASLVIPQVDTVEQCKHVLSASKYGTKQRGSRSAPPFRLIPGLTDTPMLGDDVHKSINNQAAVIIQIESLEGINNLDAILTECPDVDAVWLGSLDARVSMNLAAKPMEVHTEPEWIEAEAKFTSTMKKHNKPRAGFGVGLEAAKARAAEGYSFIAHDADVLKLCAIGQTFMECKAAISK